MQCPVLTWGTAYAASVQCSTQCLVLTHSTVLPEVRGGAVLLTGQPDNVQYAQVALNSAIAYALSGIAYALS
eukprot:3903178-Rhodomonas_salina.1